MWRGPDGLFGERQGKVEAAALAEGVVDLDPDPAAVIFDHLLDDGEADARTGIIVLLMQPLKDHKDPVEIFGADADSVVLDE